jgi:hypothetical protein
VCVCVRLSERERESVCVCVCKGVNDWQDTQNYVTNNTLIAYNSVSETALDYIFLYLPKVHKIFYILRKEQHLLPIIRGM